MQRLVWSFAFTSLCAVGCKKKEADKPAEPAPPVAPVVAADAAAAAAEPIDAAERYRMKKGGLSELIKLDPLPAGWTREDDDTGTLKYVVEDPSLEDGKLEITVFIERMRTGTKMKTPADWSAAEVDHMKAKLTKTETVGKATIFDFKADQTWFWAYVPLDEGMLWRCGSNLHDDQKLPAVKDAVATARKLCASMTL
jgi:hypothetical protein